MHAPSRIEIPAFPGNRRFALTTSWDDGRVYDRQVVAMLNQLGIKGTFNLNSGVLDRGSDGTGHIRADEVATLFSGHEVAIHTVTHPFLDRLDASQIALEVLEDRQRLESLVGYPVRGMAYPFGAYSQRVIDVLGGLGIVYSRTVENAWSVWPAKEPLAWATTCHQFVGPSGAGEKFTEWVNGRWSSGLFYVWGHSYEFAEAGRSWADLERIYKPMAGRTDTWYCTNIELFDYEAARQRIVIAANRMTAFNPSALSVTLLVDGKVVEVPGGKTLPLMEIGPSDKPDAPAGPLKGPGA